MFLVLFLYGNVAGEDVPVLATLLKENKSNMTQLLVNIEKQKQALIDPNYNETEDKLGNMLFVKSIMLSTRSLGMLHKMTPSNPNVSFFVFKKLDL